jgi:O-succinylbenzoate synthase
MGPVRYWRIPLRTRFRDLDARAGVLFRGRLRWGEFSPFADYSPALAARWLAAARAAANEPWPRAVRTHVPVNVTVPAVTPQEAHALVAASGCTTAKVKIGTPDDEARLEAVRDALGPGGKMRVDANGRWDVGTAVRRIRALARHDLEYVEQPVATLDELAELRRRVDVPVAVDESLRTAPDPRRVPVARAADVAVLKVAPLGGVRAALEVAEACAMPVVVSSALETSVGLEAGLALAAALPELPYACGLATAALLAADVTDRPLLPEGGALEVRNVEVDEARLAAVEVPAAQAPNVVRLLQEARADGVPAAEIG